MKRQNIKRAEVKASGVPKKERAEPKSSAVSVLRVGPLFPVSAST